MFKRGKWVVVNGYVSNVFLPKRQPGQNPRLVRLDPGELKNQLGVVYEVVTVGGNIEGLLILKANSDRTAMMVPIDRRIKHMVDSKNTSGMVQDLVLVSPQYIRPARANEIPPKRNPSKGSAGSWLSRYVNRVKSAITKPTSTRQTSKSKGSKSK